MNKKILIIFVITLFLDQLTKSLVQAFIKLEYSLEIIKNFFSLTYVNNYGAAWSILSNKNTFLIIISIVSLVIIYRFMYVFNKNKRNNVAFGLLFGGISGNLIDRALLGYVRDFLDFKIFNYNYPIFNFADSFICIGVLILLYSIYLGEDNENSSK